MSNTITLPGGITLTLPGNLSFPPSGTSQPSFQLPNLPALPQGGLPDLSTLLPVLTPIISAAVPGIGPFLPVIGVLLHTAYILSQQMQATATSGTPNPGLQAVHDAFWQQVLGAFGQKPTPLPAPASG